MDSVVTVELAAVEPDASAGQAMFDLYGLAFAHDRGDGAQWGDMGPGTGAGRGGLLRGRVLLGEIGFCGG